MKSNSQCAQSKSQKGYEDDPDYRETPTPPPEPNRLTNYFSSAKKPDQPKQEEEEAPRKQLPPRKSRPKTFAPELEDYEACFDATVVSSSSRAGKKRRRDSMESFEAPSTSTPTKFNAVKKKKGNVTRSARVQVAEPYELSQVDSDILISSGDLPQTPKAAEFMASSSDTEQVDLFNGSPITPDKRVAQRDEDRPPTFLGHPSPPNPRSPTPPANEGPSVKKSPPSSPPVKPKRLSQANNMFKAHLKNVERKLFAVIADEKVQHEQVQDLLEQLDRENTVLRNDSTRERQELEHELEDCHRTIAEQNLRLDSSKKEIDEMKVALNNEQTRRREAEDKHAALKQCLSGLIREG